MFCYGYKGSLVPPRMTDLFFPRVSWLMPTNELSDFISERTIDRAATMSWPVELHFPGPPNILLVMVRLPQPVNIGGLLRQSFTTMSCLPTAWTPWSTLSYVDVCLVERHAMTLSHSLARQTTKAF